MKVLQVMASVGWEASGPSYSVPGLCRGLMANDCTVSLHLLDGIPETLAKMGFEVVNYPRHDKLGVGWSPEMRAGLNEAVRGVDIVHANAMWMMPCVYPAWAVKHMRRNNVYGVPKLVISPRGSLAEWSLRKGWLKKRLFGALWQYPVLRMADMFHATSQKEYEEIRRAGYRQPVAIVPIGMDLPEAHVASTTTWGTPGKKKLVFFGRIHKVKAVDRLVRAWQLLTSQGAEVVREWEFLIAGPDRGVKTELQSFIADNGIPRVFFVGEINGSAKYEFLSQANLYVLPSFTENFGITVAESLACGTPVIASRGTPWQGLVKNRCGWWVDNDPASLADAILEAMTVPEAQLERMGITGRSWIKRDFSWPEVGFKMRMAYEWLADRTITPEYVIVD